MTFVFGSRPELGYDCRARLDGRRLVSEHVPLIRRLIWSGRLYCPSPDVSRRCSPEPLPLCLDGEVVRAGVRHKQPICLAHVVANLVHQHDYILTVLAQGPRHRIMEVADASDDSLLGARGRIPWQQGPGSIYH